MDFVAGLDKHAGDLLANAPQSSVKNGLAARKRTQLQKAAPNN